MNLDKQYIKYFPEHEDIFIGDIDQYRKHFLPICSINLQAIYPEEDQWIHFVSLNEIYDGCVGRETHEYHTEYCREDMIGFNVIDNKFELEADWKYFILEHQLAGQRLSNEEIINQYRNKLQDFGSQDAVNEWVDSFGEELSRDIISRMKSQYKSFTSSQDMGFVNAMLDRFQQQAILLDKDNLEGAYLLNQQTYNLVKRYYKKHANIYPFPPGNFFNKIFTIEDLELKMKKDRFYARFREMYGILEDIQFHSLESVCLRKEYNIPLKDMKSFKMTNLTELPRDKEGNIFEYIGSFTGYLFQCFGADKVYLFYSKELKKATICLEYS